MKEYNVTIYNKGTHIFGRGGGERVHITRVLRQIRAHMFIYFINIFLLISNRTIIFILVE